MSAIFGWQGPSDENPFGSRSYYANNLVAGGPLQQKSNGAFFKNTRAGAAQARPGAAHGAATRPALSEKDRTRPSAARRGRRPATPRPRTSSRSSCVSVAPPRCMRRLGPRDPQPPRLGHRPLQLPLPLLHAGRRASLAAQARGAHLRGDPAAGRRDGRAWASTRSASPAASRWSAATSPSSSSSSRQSRACAISRSPPTACCSTASPPRWPPPGCGALNVSLDSLSHTRFAEITRRDALDRVLAGLTKPSATPSCARSRSTASPSAASPKPRSCALAELARRKPYVVRFIEYMPLDADGAWRGEEVLTGAEIREIIERRWPLEELPAEPSSTARRFRFADGAGELGFVSPVSEPFCSSCDRIRLTADGQLRTCLFSRREWDLRGPLREGASDARAGGAHPPRGRPQGTQAPHQRARLRPRQPNHEPDRWLTTPRRSDQCAVPTLAAAALTVAAAAAPVASAGDAPQATASAKTVKVTGGEFWFRLSSKSAPKGRVTFRFTNNGSIKHDFKIAGKKSKPDPQGQDDVDHRQPPQGQLQVRLHRPGPRRRRHEGQVPRAVSPRAVRVRPFVGCAVSL